MSLLNIFNQFTTLFQTFFSSCEFLLAAHILSLFFKLYLLVRIISWGIKTFPISKILAYTILITVLISSSFENFAWIIALIYRLQMFSILPYHFNISVGFAWILAPFTNHCIVLLLESLIEQGNRVARYHFLLLPITFSFFTFFTYLFFFEWLQTNPNWSLIIKMEGLLAFYGTIIIPLCSILYLIKKMRTTTFPRIIRHQLKTFTYFLFFPIVSANFAQAFPFTFFNDFAPNMAAAGAFTIFLVGTIYYCSKKIIQLRFLNIHDHVHSSQPFNFMDDLKIILEQLGHATSLNEIKFSVQQFMYKSFSINASDIALYVRKIHPRYLMKYTTQELDSQEIAVENFIRTSNYMENNTQAHFLHLQKNKIFIRDEIAFNYFHAKHTIYATILSFMESIQADIFLPLFENETLIAYIIIAQNTRPKTLYSDTERDEMIVFASYLTKVINLIQNRDIHEVLKQYKEITEELYAKHQEIKQYKESMRSFLRTQKDDIGILFYKNRHFSFGNSAAQKILGIDPNTEIGHPLTKTLKLIARNTEEYRTTQTQFSHTMKGERVVISGIPNKDGNNIILTITHPDVSAMIKNQFDQIKDPSNWDYLLYLETTQTGKLINDLIPDGGPDILNFKLEFLRLTLSKKALLLDVPDDDLIDMVELFHHVSLRETVYALNLQKPVNPAEIAIKLFGINPIFGQQDKQPLLERLDRKGTLFIKDIHFLDFETQHNLAEYIRYGFYRVYKSDKKMQSDVRIICSTKCDLSTLVEEETFSLQLFNELKKASLSLPCLTTLSETEMDQLVDSYAEQTLSSSAYQNMLALTSREKKKIIEQHPISLCELKRNIQRLLINKSKKSEVFHDSHFDPAYNISDPELAEAVRLGKNALRDKAVFMRLWHKFKSQSKIALFLGVNRSSVHRRCKEYNLV